VRGQIRREGGSRRKSLGKWGKGRVREGWGDKKRTRREGGKVGEGFEEGMKGEERSS